MRRDEKDKKRGRFLLSRRFLRKVLSLLLALSLTTAPGRMEKVWAMEDTSDIAGHLGADYYLVAAGTEKGNLYANESGRTYNPSTGEMGIITGYLPDGQALVSLDQYALEDVLGQGYSLLAYTPEKGNCYVSITGVTFNPCTQEIGVFLGTGSDGLPVIQILGIPAYIPVVHYYPAPTSAPVEQFTEGVPSQVTPTPTSASAAPPSYKGPVTAQIEDSDVTASLNGGASAYIAENATGPIFHVRLSCGNLSTYTTTTVAEAVEAGNRLCKNCAKAYGLVD